MGRFHFARLERSSIAMLGKWFPMRIEVKPADSLLLNRFGESFATALVGVLDAGEYGSLSRKWPYGLRRLYVIILA